MSEIARYEILKMKSAGLLRTAFSTLAKLVSSWAEEPYTRTEDAHLRAARHAAILDKYCSPPHI